MQTSHPKHHKSANLNLLVLIFALVVTSSLNKFPKFNVTLNSSAVCLKNFNCGVYTNTDGVNEHSHSVSSQAVCFAEEILVRYCSG